MKKPWASCKTQEEKLRYYQVASHESFAAANADLAKQHGVAQGRAKALAEARAQFQSEKRKAESIATRFAKRQAAMLEYESCLANSPLKPQRGAASAGGASAASARDGRSTPSSFTASFTAGQQCPDCGEGQLSAKVSAKGRRYWDVRVSDQVQQSNPAPFFDTCKKRWILMLVCMIELADVG